MRFLLLMLLSFNAWAAEYWVDCTNGDDANDGLSVGEPKLTVAGITQGSGDTINLSGACSEMITIGANSITINSDDTTIDATGENYGITSTDRTGLTITGTLAISTPTLSGVLINCTTPNTDVTARITGVSVSGTVGNGASIGNGFRWFCADVTLTDTSANDTYSDGYYCDTCDNTIITRPRVTNFADGDTDGDGIQIVDSDNFQIIDPYCEHPNTGTKLCIIHGVTTNTGGLIEGGEVIGGVDGAVSCSGNGCVVRQMYIHDVLAGSDGTANGYGIKLLGNGKAYGNIIDNAKTCFFSNAASTTVEYYNNACHLFRNRGMDANTTNAVTLKFQNNIVSAASSVTSSARMIVIGTGVTETISHNRYPKQGSALWADSGTTYATLTLWQAHSIDASSTEGAAGYVGGEDPSTAEGFRLAADSPLRGAGTYISGGLQDYGNRRCGTPPETGAWCVGSGDARETITTRSSINP